LPWVWNSIRITLKIIRATIRQMLKMELFSDVKTVSSIIFTLKAGILIRILFL